MAAPIEVEVYSEELKWFSKVPCTETTEGQITRYQPEQGSLPGSGEASAASPLCLLNEPRVRFGGYAILHYNMSTYHDDGPPALDQIVETGRIIEEALEKKMRVAVYCPVIKPRHEPFSALCVAAHRVLFRGADAAAAIEPWGDRELLFLEHSWAPKAKAAPRKSLSVASCLTALQVARDKGWLNASAFDCKEYFQLWEKYDCMWLTPGSIQILGDPVTTVLDPDPKTAKHLAPEDGEGSFVSFLQGTGTKLIVRMNLNEEPGLKKSYDPKVFEKNGISHLECSYRDVGGGVPPKSIVSKIIRACEALPAGAAVAFHCKAGFGRSVVCAAAWLMHKEEVHGPVAYAWSRMCRPGAITTTQQAKYLLSLEHTALVQKEPQQDCCALQ